MPVLANLGDATVAQVPRRLAGRAADLAAAADLRASAEPPA